MRKLAFTWQSIALLIVGAAGSYRISIIGELRGSDILILALLPYAWARSEQKIFSSRDLKLFVCAMLGAAIALMLADVVHDTPAETAARGVANFIMCIAAVIFFISVANDRPASLAFFLGALGLSLLINHPPNTEIEAVDLFTGGNEFKQYVAPGLMPIVIAVTLLLEHFRKRRMAILFVLSTGIVVVVLGARSFAFILLMGIIIFGTRNRLWPINVPKLIISGFVLLCGVWLLYTLFVFAILHGYIASQNTSLYLEKMVNPLNMFEFLFWNRIHAFLTFFAIAEQPFWGYGSWAADENGQFLWVWGQQYGISLDLDRLLIPAHSVFAASWLWGGILCCLAVTLAYGVFVRAYLRGGTSSSYALTLSVAVALAGWHFFFSPFGHIRTTFPPVAALVFICTAYSRSALGSCAGYNEGPSRLASTAFTFRRVGALSRRASYRPGRRLP